MTNWPWPLNGVQDWWEGLWNNIINQATRVVREVTDTMWDWLIEPILRWFPSFNAFIKQQYDWFVSILSRAEQTWNFLTGDLKPWLDWSWKQLSDFITSVPKRLSEIYNNIIGFGDFVRDLLGQRFDDLYEYLKPKWDKLVDDFTEVINPTLDRLQVAWSNFQDWIKLHVTDPWGDWLKGLNDMFMPFLTKFWADATTTYTKVIQDFWKWFTDQVVPFVRNVTSGTANAILEGIKWIDDYVRDSIGSGLDSIENYVKTLQQASPDQTMSITMSFLRSQAIMRQHAKMFSLSLQVNPIFRGVPFEDVFEGGEWQAVLGGIAGGFASGVIMSAVGKPIQYMMNRYIRPEILDPSTLQTAYLRGDISETDWAWNMQSWGFDDSKIDIIRKTYQWVPGPQDLIRLAVREAFAPESELQLQYISSDYMSWMKKQGAERWSKPFWHAHWVLPSIGNLNEMLWRKVTDLETWRKFVILNDYWPAMVDNLQKIIYTPYTRVDIRRMYVGGVIDRDQVNKAYHDIGYDDEHAENLTKWTETQRTQVGKELTLSMITKSFRLGNTDRTHAIEMVMDLGYSQEEADFIISTYEVQETETVRELSQARYDALYQAGIIDENELKRQLIALNYSTTAAEKLVQLENFKLAQKVSFLPVGTLREAYRRKIIDNNKLAEKMRVLGYMDDEIEIVIALEGARAAS